MPQKTKLQVNLYDSYVSIHDVLEMLIKILLQKPKVKQRKCKKTPSKTKLSDAAKLSEHLQNVSLNKNASKPLP